MAAQDATISLRQFCARYFDVEENEVTSSHLDPVIAILRETLGVDAEFDADWLLDVDTEKNLRHHLVESGGGQAEAEDEADDPWREWIAWSRRFFGDPSFDETERSYKLKISERLQEAQAAVGSGSPEWPSLIKRAFSPPNNLTHYITHSRFLDWVAEHQDEARGALLALWDESGQLDQRIDDFTQRLPKTMSSAGSRLEVTSFLLLVDPKRYLFYKPTPIKTAAALVDYPSFPNEPDSAVYRHAQEFADTFLEAAQRYGLKLRDRLDVQSLVFVLTRADPTNLDWPEQEIEAFLRYRGERPSIWWVNQGQSYWQELEHGVVAAPVASAAGRVLQHHKNVSLVRKGDIILHYADRHIRAISVVTHKPEERPRPYDADGAVSRVTRAKYLPLADPIEVRGLELDRRIDEGGPFDRYGGVKQVYLVEVSVSFSDWLRDTYRDRWPEGSPWALQHRSTWLFQANVNRFDLSQHLSGMEIGKQDDFSVSRFKTEIGNGDRVVLWQSGPDAGIYAIGQVSGEVFERAPGDEHYTDSDQELAVQWRLVEKVNPPLLRSQLLDHPVLKGLSVITAPQGTNHRVTDEQWAEIRKLLDGSAPVDTAKSLSEIGTFILNQGLIITERTLRRFHVSLRTRGFVILSGISGTGKTWLTEAYSEAVGARYLLVPVAPNWTTNEDLLGYLNPLDGVYHHTAFSRFLTEAAGEYAEATAAQRDPVPFMLCLDEMNLARVEYYFAKFLSAMEVQMRRGTADLELAADHVVQLTPNLWFVGTVNIDETTHGFADKVFDRAQLIEMEAPRGAIAEHIGQGAFRQPLLELYDAVAAAKPFGFRVVDEIKSYIGESEPLEVEWHDALDEQILQKVLTKLTGADPAIRVALDQLISVAEQHGFNLTSAKARRMLDAYDRDGFTSYF